MALPPRIQKPGSPAQTPPPADEGAQAKASREKEQLELEVKEVEEALEELKARYDQYFLGIERREPSRQRDELRKRVLRVKEAFTRNTGLKFRIQTLHARFLSYERMWMRSAREKEEGTYRRDLFKARLHRSHREEEAAPAPAPEKQGPPSPPARAGGEGRGEGAKTPVAPPPRPGAPQPPALPVSAKPGAAPAPRPAAGGMSDAQLRKLYDQYVAAKRSCNEDTSRFTVDALARTLAKQVPELLSRFRAKGVDFRVAVKDGRPVLKAVPRV